MNNNEATRPDCVVKTPMQLDFFNDSHSVALRNDVILALLRCDVPASKRAWETLSKHHPQEDCLDDLMLLIKALTESTSSPFQSHAELCNERLALQNKITPSALHGLGRTEALPWLGQRWQDLAQRATALPYRAEHPQDHAAPLWLQARQWQAAADAVAGIESWRRIPAPLSWMLHARLKLQGLQANWGLLAELAWLSPQRLADVMAQVVDPILQTLATQFEQDFDGTGDTSDLAWLPAWVLTQRPALASALTQAQASQHTEPEQALRVLLELLGLERQGRQRDVIERRIILRGLHAGLYSAYMASR